MTDNTLEACCTTTAHRRTARTRGGADYADFVYAAHGGIMVIQQQSAGAHMRTDYDSAEFSTCPLRCSTGSTVLTDKLQRTSLLRSDAARVIIILVAPWRREKRRISMPTRNITANRRALHAASCGGVRISADTCTLYLRLPVTILSKRYHESALFFLMYRHPIARDHVTSRLHPCAGHVGVAKDE
eukprot:IDg17465t1